MSWLVQPRLVNAPFSDPGLYLDLRHGRRALLFDLGDLAPLSSRELVRVRDAFVSHAHMDHFAGFDRLLRLCLHRPEPLRLVGPRGFCDRVAHRLQSYAWNLLGPQSVDFRLHVAEFDGVGLARQATFRARAAFAREEGEPDPLPAGVVLDDEAFRVEAAALDHGIPSLAFALREKLKVSVRRPVLDELGLSVGPWINEVKRAIRRGVPDDAPVGVGEGRTVPLGTLRGEAFQVGPGQVVAYAVDCAFTPDTVAAVASLARGADQLFIEAAFLDEDHRLAESRRHLTAGQAGTIARQAGARHMSVLHHSPRYLDRPDALQAEAEAAFKAPSRWDAELGPVHIRRPSLSVAGLRPMDRTIERLGRPSAGL